MKYGLYYFRNTHNLGDDMWAYAQSLFYPHIDYLIDNTSVYKFRSENDEDVATIIGAFVEPRNYEWSFFPPSNLIPFFAGAYFRSTMWEFLQNDEIRKYLKAFEPIGTRTVVNATNFLNLGIDAYYAGCITMTLPKRKKNKSNYVCLVDVPDYVERYVREALGENVEFRKMTHDLPQLGQDVYLKHRNLSIKDRFKQIEDILQIYADARLVVTSRLHCALPCLTQDTPILLTLPKDGSGIVDMYDRMESFLEFFHMCWYEDFKEGSVNYDFQNPPSNPKRYLIYRDALNESINDFILRCENGEIVRNEVFSEKERQEVMADILENKVYQLKNVVDSKNYIIAQNMEGVLKLQKRLRKYETFNEWENVEFFRDWSERAKIMSDFIVGDCKSILDIGCGEMHIKKYLKEGIKYYGCDYKKRDSDTIVCDLAVGEFPNIYVDTCFMAGVLEYLNNWKDVLKAMSMHCRQIVLSYSTSEAALNRDPRWVNNITEEELLRCLADLGFVIKGKKKVNVSSFGYNLIKKNGNN